MIFCNHRYIANIYVPLKGIEFVLNKLFKIILVIALDLFNEYVLIVR